jgi:radical SAM superfamily enzyme YgiQ (UPF0313 family)
MHVLLVFPNIFTPLSFSPAVQILSAVLKEAGHSVSLLHIHKNLIPNDEETIIKEIKKINPDVIGFTSTSFEYERVEELAGAIKKEVETPVILGGIHATISPEDFKGSNFGCWVVGEGEKAMVSIANGEIKPEGIIHGEMEEDLDVLPFNDWDIMDSARIIKSKGNWLDIAFSRGCPFDCAFCANALLKKIKGKPYVRKRNIDKCIEELKYIISKFDVKVVNFADDEFTLNHKWVSEFLKKYKAEILDKHDIQFVIEARVDTINDKTAKLLKECGCLEIQFGVETCSPRLLKFLNKGITNEKTKEAFDICKKYDINTYVYMMIGIPTETEKDIMETMKFLAIIRPRIIRPTFLCPVKGTQIYDYCVEHKLLSKNVTVWNFESPLKLKSIDSTTLFRYWFLYPWVINSCMGYEEYTKKVEEYFKKDTTDPATFDTLLEDDIKLSKEMRKKKLEHYVYKAERKKGDRKFRFNRFELVKP